jgi:hypothetical protein
VPIDANFTWIPIGSIEKARRSVSVQNFGVLLKEQNHDQQPNNDEAFDDFKDISLSKLEVGILLENFESPEILQTHFSLEQPLNEHS